MNAEEICENLGFTVEEAEQAHQRVLDRMDRIDNWEEKMTSRTITGDTKVHMHQLIRGNDGSDWVVTDLHKHAIELAEVEMDGDDMVWGEESVFTPGDFIMEFEPQYEVFEDDVPPSATYESVDKVKVPVWVH